MRLERCVATAWAIILGMLSLLLPLHLWLTTRSIVRSSDGALPYPPSDRSSPSPCANDNVAIFVAYTDDVHEEYAESLESVKCYAAMHGHPLFMVDLHADEITNNHCYYHSNVYFRKHCSVAAHLSAFPSIEWLLVLDADTGVINPRRCISEFIDPSVNMVFYERFMNFEIAAGNYLVKNTNYSTVFLRRWAAFEFERQSDGDVFMYADQGALLIHVLSTITPSFGGQPELAACRRLRDAAKNYDQQMKFVACVRCALGSSMRWEGKLKVLRKGHGFVLDWFLTLGLWTESTSFLQHGWKDLPVSGGEVLQFSSPFTRPLRLHDDCSFSSHEWPYVVDAIEVDLLRGVLQEKEEQYQEMFPLSARQSPCFVANIIRECWPKC